MLKRAIIICFLALVPSLLLPDFGATKAFAQADICINAGGAACGTALTGNAISSTGYNPSVSGALFVPAASSMQSGSQVTLSYDIKTTSLNTATTTIMVDTRPPGGAPSGGGFFSAVVFSQNPDFFYDFAANPAGNSQNADNCRSNAGRTCTRIQWINDGNWHHVCQVYGSQTNTFVMIDGVIRDFNTGAGASSLVPGFTPSTSYWIIGSAGTASYALRELQSKQTAMLPSDCVNLYQYHSQNLEPSTGPYAPSTWSVSLPMNACNGSGCADNSGNGNNGIYDTSAPVCSITGALANGFSGLTGNQTATISCSDAVGVNSVNWYFDGVLFASPTATPFSATLPTANYEDGSHTIIAHAVNPGGKTGTATATGTTSNGNTALTYYVNSSSGSDSNNCTATATPCASMNGVQLKIGATKLFPGSSILFAAGQNFNITSLTTSTVLFLAGPNCTGICDFAQNVTHGGHVITIGTYGGSGNCHPEAAVTTDCATITMSANGTATYNMGMINALNVQNVLVENLRLIGSQTNAIFCSTVTTTSGCARGIKFASANGFVNYALLGSQDAATNNEIIDFNSGIMVSQQYSYSGNFPAGGPFCGASITDNYIHGSTTTSSMGDGILIVGTSCSDKLINPSASVVSNVINDVSGEGGAAGDGSGIVSVNSVFNYVDNFNVVGNVGNFNDSCGGDYNNWWYQSSGITVLGNESYNNFPAGTGACDSGAFDLDNGTAFATLQDNYGHNTWGPSVEILNAPTGGITNGNYSISYNIFEGTNAQTIDSGGCMICIESDTGFANLYNNTFWNSKNGTTTSPNTAQTRVGTIGIQNTCPPAAYIANNIGVANSNSSSSTPAEFYYGGFNLFCTGTTVKIVSNDWFGVGTASTSYQWYRVNNTFPTTLATWNSAASANDILVNPGFSGSPPLTLTCTAVGSGVPTAPGAIPCPTGYQITHSAATENTGTDLSQAPYSFYTTTLDFFGNTVPYTGHGGTGTNIGADGAFR